MNAKARMFPIRGFCRYCLILLCCNVFANHSIGQEAEDDLFGAPRAADNKDDKEKAQDNPKALPSVNHRYLRKHLKLQRALIRRTCKLTDEETKALDSIGDDFISEILNEPKDGKKGNWLGNIVNGRLRNANGMQNQLNVEAAIKGLAKTDERLLRDLSEANREIVKKEKEESTLFRAEAQAQLILVILDRHLVFTEEQKKQLEAPIANWSKKQDLFMAYYAQANGMVPNIPSSFFDGILSKDQLAAYNSLNKHNYDRLTYDLQILPHLENEGNGDPFDE